MRLQNRRIYSFDSFHLDVANRRLLNDEKPVSLSAKAFDLLRTLLENRGRLVEKDELFNSVWRDQVVEESNLTVHISQIRKALGENKNNPRYIETVPGYGYRFVGEVDPDNEEFVIETQTLARITVEKEEPRNEKTVLWTATNGHRPTLARPARGAWPFIATVLGGLAVAAASAFGLYYLKDNAAVEKPFEKFSLTRLTNSGKVSVAAISPDGKYITYALGEAEGNSLWIQQIGGAGSVRILPPVKAKVYELTFTPDGSHIVYCLFGGDNSDPQFFRISSLGGVSERMPNIAASYISFSPDGKHIAYAQSDSAAKQNYLMIADPDGSNKRQLAAKSYPNTFETEVPVVAWSPDGKTIACLVNNVGADATYSSIIGIDLDDGSERPLIDQRWYNVFSIEWSNNGGFLVSASNKVSGSNQVQFLSYPEGGIRQVTNDLSSYDTIGAAADGSAFIGIQTNTSSGIYVGDTGADADGFHEIVSETGVLHPIVWAPNGKIIFRSNKDGVSNLWSIDPDGENRLQLTKNAQVDTRHLCMPPDGRYLVFGSWRGGKSNLWRVDADGGNLTQLTHGEGDLYPTCSSDNRTVVYQRGFSSTPMLWKVDIAGGEPVQLTDFYSKWNSISNDDRRISYFYMDDGKWRIGIVPREGGPVLQSVIVPATFTESHVRWSADDSSLIHISAVGNVGNVRSLPLDGSQPNSLTNFKSHALEAFALSPDHKQLAVTRAASVSDVVMIRNESLP